MTAETTIRRGAEHEPDWVEVAPRVRPQTIGRSGFFDPVTHESPGVVVLQRVSAGGENESFRLRRQIGYWDAELDLAVVVPHDSLAFASDLTSVPRFFTWLVPKTGSHLPAALLHDGLVHDDDEPASYLSTGNQRIDRQEADRIFRDAMADLGTPWLRRWLVWAAVAVATMFKGRRRDVAPRALVVVATIATIVVLGGMATLDLFDCKDVLPWMGQQSTWAEIGSGFGAAAVVAAALSVLWGRGRRRAGLLVGLALALLLHVTIAVGLVLLGYTALERLFSRRYASALLLAATAAGTFALLVAGISAAC